MIQRIQSLYLLVVAVLSALIFVFPLYSADMAGSLLNVDAMEGQLLADGGVVDSSSHPYVLIAAILVGALSLGVIFLFNNRTLQMKLSRLVGLLATILLVAMFYAVEDAKELVVNQEVLGNYGLACYLPIAMIILSFLASRAIMKDEALVRSANRLR